MIQEFQAFLTLFRQGKQLENSATWKNRTVATNAVVTLLAAATVIAKGFGYDLQLDDQVVQALGAGIVAAVAFVNAVMHVITSAKVGLPAKADAGPAGISAAGG